MPMTDIRTKVNTDAELSNPNPRKSGVSFGGEPEQTVGCEKLLVSVIRRRARPPTEGAGPQARWGIASPNKTRFYV